MILRPLVVPTQITIGRKCWKTKPEIYWLFFTIWLRASLPAGVFRASLSGCKDGVNKHIIYFFDIVYLNVENREKDVIYAYAFPKV